MTTQRQYRFHLQEGSTTHARPFEPQSNVNFEDVEDECPQNGSKNEAGITLVDWDLLVVSLVVDGCGQVVAHHRVSRLEDVAEVALGVELLVVAPEVACPRHGHVRLQREINQQRN